MVIISRILPKVDNAPPPLLLPSALDTDWGEGQHSVPQHVSQFLQVHTICFGLVPFGNVACANACSGDGVVVAGVAPSDGVDTVVVVVGVVSAINWSKL